jgi:AraC-like DNA-binding protein
VLLKENHIGIYDWNHCPDKVIYKKGKFKGIGLLLHTEQAVPSIEPFMQRRQRVIWDMQQILYQNHKLFLAFGNRDLKSVFLGIIENPLEYDRDFLMLKAMELILISSKTMKQSKQGEVREESDAVEYRMLCKAKDYIELHIADPITVSDIAYELGTGVRNVNRIFGSYENQTVYQFLKIARLKRAKELLLASDHSVTDIALEVGWNNASKFSIAFKERYGDSPLTYRNARK